MTTTHSAFVRSVTAHTVANRVALNLRLGTNQAGMLAAFLQYDGTQQSWTWGKPYLHARTQASLAKRGLILPNGDGSYRPNEDLVWQYQRALANAATE